MARLVDLAKAVLLASAAALGAAPLVAQSNGAATAPPPSNSSDIGPGELSNFTLNGTVTSPANRPPAAQPPPPAARPDAVAPTTGDRPAAPTSASPPAAARPNPADSDLFRRPPTLPDASAANAVIATPPLVSGDRSAVIPALEEGISLLPWIVALLALAGAGVMFFGRKRRQQRYATADNASIDITRPEPAPGPVASPRSAPPPAPTGGARRPLPTTLMPQPAAPPVRPRASGQARPDPVIPGGIVSTSLRPWIDVELTPDRALLDEAGVAIAFEVTLFNSGSAAARDVIIEARLLNAGAHQDAELSAFFSASGAPGDPIPQIAPYARIPLRSAARLTRAEIREYDIEGRKLFMPLLAISVRYRWSSGDGHSAAGFLVGQGKTGQEKLAPLRLDRGARSWKGLGVRRYEKGLRS
ncbi:MAG: hypothetical protein ABIR25_08135 [Sphingomicrobium sp.]